MPSVRALVLACAFGASLASGAAAAPGGAAAGTSSGAAASWSRGLLFRLERPGVAPSYVFGTVHFGDPRVLALAAPVRKAFAAARTLAVEIRLGEGDLEDVFAAAQFDDGRRLDAFFDAQTMLREQGYRVRRSPASPRGRPKGEYRSAKHEGSPMRRATVRSA